MDNHLESPSDIVLFQGVEVPQTSVHMVRHSFDDIPKRDLTTTLGRIAPMLPKDYRIRTYRPNDDMPWVRTIRAAERFFEVDDGLFDREFGSNAEQLSERMFLLEWVSPDAEATLIGTATAWWKDNWVLKIAPNNPPTDRGEWGQVHWVAIHPDHQGRGLSKPLMAAVMDQLAQNHSRAMLSTSTARIWAIKVYLDLGFLPDEEELTVSPIRYAWEQTHKALNHPALESVL